MILWFVALSFVAVMTVFDTPALDYRLIMAGSLLPWLDFLWGPPWVMHSVFFPVAVMAAVMVFGWGRRLAQRRWLGLAIGLFMHLVLAGTWTDADLVWWPALGSDVGDLRPSVPSVPVIIGSEVVGLVAVVWLWRRLAFDRPEHRAQLVRTGQVSRSVLRGDVRG